MDHTDHLDLLRNGVLSSKRSGSYAVWADFGSGWGAFTFALAELLGPGAQIYSVDKDPWVLRKQQDELKRLYPFVKLIEHNADFTNPIDLPKLDGIVMANSLHFVPRAHQMEVVNLVKGYLHPEGCLILIEYNVDRGNIWVPYPLSLGTWIEIAQNCGFHESRLLTKKTSSFLKEIYSVVNIL